MSFLLLSLASGLRCSTTVILINLAEKNDESEIKSREKCEGQSRESKGFHLSNDKTNWFFCLEELSGRVYCIDQFAYYFWGWFGVRVHLLFILKEKEHLLKPSDGRSTSLHRSTRLLTKGQFCAACGDVLEPMYLIPVTLGTGVGEMDNCNFTVNLQDEGLSTLFFTGWFSPLVCDRISLRPHWAETSLLVANTWGMIQGITEGMSFRTVVHLLLPLLCWASCLHNEVPKSTITKWIFFYWDLGIWELFCHTVMLLLQIINCLHRAEVQASEVGGGKGEWNLHCHPGLLILGAHF